MRDYGTAEWEGGDSECEHRVGLRAPEQNTDGQAGYLNTKRGTEPANVEPHPAGRNRRSVWEIATAPFAAAHFATFPPKLVEPCILAGSPPKCCGECGAPWERVTERARTRDGEPLEGDWGATDGQRIGPSGVGHWRDETKVETLGWRSTCVHDDDSGRSTVLDPFAGSGTTGVVALRHDRAFIGIELNESYCELARNRIRDDAPLLNHGLEVAA